MHSTKLNFCLLEYDTTKKGGVVVKEKKNADINCPLSNKHKMTYNYNKYNIRFNYTIFYIQNLKKKYFLQNCNENFTICLNNE